MKPIKHPEQLTFRDDYGIEWPYHYQMDLSLSLKSGGKILAQASYPWHMAKKAFDDFKKCFSENNTTNHAYTACVNDDYVKTAHERHIKYRWWLNPELSLFENYAISYFETIAFDNIYQMLKSGDVSFDVDPCGDPRHKFIIERKNDNLFTVTIDYDLGISKECKAPPVSDLPEKMSFIETPSHHFSQRFRSQLPSGEWQTGDGTWPTIHLKTKDCSGYAELRPDPEKAGKYLSEEDEARWKEQMAEQIRELDDLTVDILDILTHVWLAKARNPEESVYITTDDILRMRGLELHRSGSGRRGGFRKSQRQEIEERIDALSNTWIKINEWKYYDKKMKNEVTLVDEGRAVELSRRLGKLKSDGSVEAYAWRFRLGGVLAEYCFKEGRQTALLSFKALNLNTLRQVWEKRLARHLSWQWRIRKSKESCEQPYRVSTLLETIFLHVDKVHPKRTVNRFEKALDTLQASGIISGWSYVIEQQEADWLNKRVVIEPPPEIIGHYSKIEERAARKKVAKRLPAPKSQKQQAERAGEMTSEEFDPALLKTTREQRGLSLRESAKQIGISPGMLSDIEKGKVKPGKKAIASVRKWL